MPYRPQPSFGAQARIVRERLADDNAHRAWVAIGGRDRLKAAFERPVVHTFKHPDEWDDATAQLALRIGVEVREHTRTVDRIDDGLDRLAEPYQGRNGEAFSIRALGDADETELRDFDLEPAALTARERALVMLEIMQRDTGNPVTPETARDACQRREELREMTVEIGRRLERCGINAFRKTPFSLFSYFVHSGTVVELEQLRRIMFLPSVAATVRAPKVRELEAFCERNPFARMFTFTSGTRTALPDLRERLTSFHRALSKFAAKLKAVWGVEMVFRSTELGTPESGPSTRNGADGRIVRDAAGQPTFHVHAHTLVNPLTGFHSRKWWGKVRKWVWSHWPHHWDDAEGVQDVRELCKYVTKPGEILTLSDAETAALCAALERIKLVVTLGTLRETIRDRKKREMRLDRQPTPDGRVYREVPDWNRHGKSNRPLKPRKPGKRATPEALAKYEADFAAWREAQTRDFEARATIRATKEQRKGDLENVPARIVARLAPSFAPGSILAEPRVCVLAPCWRRAEIELHPFVTELRERTASEWRDALAANEFAELFARSSARASELRVHVCTPTVPEFLPGLGIDPGSAPPNATPPLVPAVN